MGLKSKNGWARNCIAVTRPPIFLNNISLTSHSQLTQFRNQYDQQSSLDYSSQPDDGIIFQRSA